MVDATTRERVPCCQVHARDIVSRLVADKVEAASSFAWQSPLKYRWDEEQHDCFINIADAEFTYSYEYVGNPGRLVITALTDRCYITLTQAIYISHSLHYIRSQPPPHTVTASASTTYGHSLHHIR